MRTLPPSLLATAGLVAALCWTEAASAKFPSPANSTVPNCVMLLPAPGDRHSGPAVSAYQPYSVALRDVANNPVGNCDLILDFSRQPDVRLAMTQEAGVLVDCMGGCVRAVTDLGGRATIAICGAGTNSLPGGGAGPGGFMGVRVFGGGALLRNITATTPDQNGAGASGTHRSGLDPGDIAFFLFDLLNYPATAGRSDLDCDGAVDPGDLSILLDFLFNDAASAAPQATTFYP